MKRFPAFSLFFACLACPALAWSFNTSAPAWFPPVVSVHGRQIDHLYMVIMYIIAAICFITQGILVYCIIFFRARPGHKARFFHGSTAVELVLAGIPALILLYITVVSARLWIAVREHEPTHDDPVRIEVLAEQFQWNFRYPGPDGVFGTPDDIYAAGDMAVPVDKQVVFYLSSKDVIHSFFLPNSRVKQDVVPGLLGRVWTEWRVIPVWDLATQKRVLMSPEQYESVPVAVSGYTLNTSPHPGKKWYQFSDSARIGYLSYHYDRDPSSPLVVMEHGKQVHVPPLYVQHYFELACAQLCGPLHFAMRGTVRVLPWDQYQAWLKAQPREGYMESLWADTWDKYHPQFDKAL